MTEVRLSTVKALDLLQARADAALDEEHVGMLVEALERGDELPPMRVVESAHWYYVVDGFHRYAAHRSADARTVHVDVCEKVTASEERALQRARWHAAASNATNGKRRALGDVARAILIAAEGDPSASDVAIAKQVRCARSYVAKVLRPQTRTATRGSHRRVTEESLTEDIASSPLSLPGGADDSPEDPPPDSGTESLSVDTGGAPSGEPVDPLGELVDAANEAADLVAVALRAAVRAARAVQKGGGPMHRAAATLPKKLEDLRKGFEQHRPVRCPECDGPGCGRCGGKGWVKRMSAGHARSVDNA